jgi:hypothetical protein
VLLGSLPSSAAAADLSLRTTFKGSPVPGVSVVASREAARVTTTTGEDGECHLTLDDGPWTIRVEMRGFERVTRDVIVAGRTVTVGVDMTLVPPDTNFGGPPPPGAEAPTPDAAPSTPARQPESTTPPAADANLAGDGLVVNASTYNAAASPFAQPRAFGNNRPGRGSLYTRTLTVSGGNSAWDARPFSFSAQPLPSPAYSDVQVAGAFAGPMKIPYLGGTRPLVNISYQRSATTTAGSVRARVPTTLERAGDFSGRGDGPGVGTPVIDPLTGTPFPNGLIPPDRLSPQALALLSYYPAPNVAGSDASNYVTDVEDRTVRDTLQLRISQSFASRHQLSGVVSYQRARTRSTSLFQFIDRGLSSDADASVTWSYRMSPTIALRARYEFTHTSARVQPFFADRVDVSGDAGIRGNDRAPPSWGPPNLNVASGLAGLASDAPRSERTRTHAASGDATWIHATHTISFGGERRGRRAASASLADPRGTFTFTGASSGDDFADFLLGLPHASAVSFGDGRVFLGATANAFVMDDWHLAPSLTINAGLRWEYESPFREQQGRLANLDIAPGFDTAAPVTPGTTAGPITGRSYGPALLAPDYRGAQPRVALSWRPLAASSLVVRAGYGIYRQSDTYLPIAIWLARQPPFTTTASLESTPIHVLTLADGLASVPDTLQNTVAVDPSLRAGFAENWQVSAQRDLPASLTASVTYLGARGHHLLQESLPNTVPPGAINPCASCPIGFIYISSNGRSLRHALQVQLRRRLHDGLAASAQYTLAKATDNAPALAGVSASGASIAQDWRDLDADWGPSAFDQRHLLTIDAEYTTGTGASGGRLTGARGALLKGWVFAAHLSAGSGLPLTPIYMTTVPGTGITGTIRATAIETSTLAPDGRVLNPAAYAAPDAGTWGTAGRHSARGPSRASLDASIARSFTIGERKTLDWRIDVTNALNRVTFVSVDTLVGSPQFGLPTRASPMRRVRMTLRWTY